MTDADFILELNLMADKIERLQDTMEGNLQAYNAVHFTKAVSYTHLTLPTIYSV